MLENNLGKQLISLQHGVDELRGRNINTINTTTIMNTSTSSTMVDNVTNLISNQRKSIEGKIKRYFDETFASLNYGLPSTTHSYDNSTYVYLFYWSWGGKNHCIPEGFILFPKDSSDNINILWIKCFFDDKLLKFGPFRNIKPTSDSSSKEVKLYSKLNIATNKLIDNAINQKYIENKDI